MMFYYLLGLVIYLIISVGSWRLSYIGDYTLFGGEPTEYTKPRAKLVLCTPIWPVVVVIFLVFFIYKTMSLLIRDGFSQ